MKERTMTATTFTHLPGRKPGSAFGGFLRRIFKNIAEVQEQRAREEVAILLRGYGDDLLTDIGYSDTEIKKLRDGQKMLLSD